MGNLSVFQLIILSLLFALIFGDFPKLVSTVKKFINKSRKAEKKTGKRELNPRPLVLETTVLPTELFSFKTII